MANPNRRSGAPRPARQYPRTARINESLREVLADALERLEDVDERLGFMTITAVDCEPDLRHAVVYLSSLDDTERAALAQARVRLQAAISHQVRLKRTPQLRFEPDPAVAAGQRVEDILRTIGPSDQGETAAVGEETDQLRGDGPPSEEM